MRKDITIGTYKIGLNHKPFIIAEMSGNHNQSLDRAFEIVDAAAKTGVQALKLQTYTADTMTINSTEKGFVIEDSNSLWKGENLYDLYKKAATPWDWHKPIMERAKKHGMLCFSTPFDETAVDFLEELDVPCYKIASFENTHLPLIEYVAKKGKPLIVSTGMATAEIIEDIVKTVRGAKNENLILLKCTSTYPAEPINTNLMTIPDMSRKFNVEVGLSDHTMGIGVSVASVAFGARVIEKHFTLRRADGGVDSAFSMEPEEMKSLVIESERAWKALGEISYKPSQSEEKSKVFRRSIFVTKDIRPGEKFSKENVKIIRPGFGMEPKYFSQVLQAKATRELKRGHPLTREDVSF